MKHRILNGKPNPAKEREAIKRSINGLIAICCALLIMTILLFGSICLKRSLPENSKVRDLIEFLWAWPDKDVYEYTLIYSFAVILFIIVLISVFMTLEYLRKKHSTKKIDKQIGESRNADAASFRLPE